MPPLGNDVVDLEASGNGGKSGDRRFLDRVFTARERQLIGAAAHPDALLWAFWAAKEAAYKAVSRGDPTVCSIPRRYPVLLDDEDRCLTQSGSAEEVQRLTGRILTPCGELALRITITDSYVHALAAGTPAVLDRVVERVDRVEESAVKDDPSAFVRTRLVLEIAERLGLSGEEIEIRKESAGPGIPRIFHRRLPLTDEISLSHDGRFTAFAWIPAA